MFREISKLAKLYFSFCVRYCLYFLIFLSLFTVLFVARTFSYLLLARAYILCCIPMLDANFLLTVTILFSLPILKFVQ